MKKTFKKEERLCSKSAIDELFHNGSSFIVYPYRVVYLNDIDAREDQSTQVILSVSKRRFKRAHDRNRIKRLMREVYRLQKNDVLYPFVKSKNLHLLLAIQYVGKEEISFSIQKDKMKKMINQLVNEIGS